MANLYDQATQRQKWDQTIDQVQKMGYPQNPAQPPAFSPPPPRQPTSVGTASAATTSKDPLDGGAAFGVFPQLAGGKRTTYAMDEKLRTGVEATGPSTFVQATPLDKTIIGGGNGQRMNATQDPRSLTATGMGAVAGVPGAAPSITPQTDVQRGGGNVPAVAPPSTNPAAPSPAATGAEIAPGVYRHGRGQYSDNAAGMGMPANFTGQPSAQNMAAGESLAARSQQESMAQQSTGLQPQGVTAPTVRHSGNDWAARNALRNAEVSASSIMNTRQWGGRGAENNPSALAYQAMLKNDLALQGAQPGVDVAAMRENAGIQREDMQQQGATTRAGMQERGSMGRTMAQAALEQQKINQAAVTQEIDNRGKTMVQALQSQIATEPDSAKRQGIAQRLREMQGQSTADPYLVVPGGQAVDEMGKPYNMPSTVFNRQTQQYVQQPKQGGAAALPPGMTKQVGTSGGKPVYEDANGKRFLAG